MKVGEQSGVGGAGKAHNYGNKSASLLPNYQNKLRKTIADNQAYI